MENYCQALHCLKSHLSYLTFVPLTVLSQGIPECQEVVKTVVQDKPHESCQLQPRRKCRAVTKLVPRLEPQEECLQVPKEVCVSSRQHQRTVKKPRTKTWCYVPS